MVRMVREMRKKLFYLTATLSALCLTLAAVFSFGGIDHANAETVSGITPTLSTTKYLKSADGTMMLLATGINNYDDCYECGYVTEGLSAVHYNTAKYYTSISTKGGKSWSAEDIFGDDYSGMIVWEVKNASTETTFKPYVKVGERVDGELYQTYPAETTVFGAQKSLKGKAALPESDDAFILEELEDYDSSAATLEFDVHLSGASDELLFRLSDNSGNYYGTYRLNNTLAGLDTSASFNHAGIKCSVLDGTNNYRITVTPVDLTGGSALAPSAITKLTVVNSASGVTTALSAGSSIENIDYEYSSVLMVGDVHIGKSAAALTYFRETLEYVRDNGIKVVIFNGDLVHCGNEDNYDAADEVLEEVFDGVSEDDLPEFLFNMGNHEFYPNNGCNYLETDYATGLALFRSFANKWMKTPIGASDNIYLRKIDGINYIVAWSSSTGNTAGESFTSADFSKLENLLNTATAGNAPCVLLTHTPWGYTYGGDSDTPSVDVVSTMTNLLKNYPSVINVTSHTHFSVLHERTLDQTYYTTVALGSQIDEFFVSGIEKDENNATITYSNINDTYKNYFVNDSQATALYDSKHFGMNFVFGSGDVTVNRVDLGSGEDYAHGEWTIPYGITSANKSSKFYYESGERSGETLSFGTGANIGVLLAKKSTSDVMRFTVTFPDVEKYYAVEGYKINIYDKDDTLVKSTKWQSLFWAGLDSKSSYEVVISSVPVSAEYTVKIFPIDFFGVYNDPLVKEIVTAQQDIDEHPDAEKVTAPKTVIFSTGLTNFAGSGKAFSFEYKATGESAKDTIQFTIWTSGWKRITELVTVDVVNNTVSDAVGKVEDIGGGWYRVTFNCSDMPIYTTASDGSETAGLAYFNVVNHDFYLDNIGFVDELTKYTVSVTNGTGGGYYFYGDTATVTASVSDEKFFARWEIGGVQVSTNVTYAFTVTDNVSITAVVAEGFTSSSAWADGLPNHYFVTPADTKVIDMTKDTISFDVMFTSNSGQLSFYLNEYYYGRYCGPFTLTTAGVLTGTGAVLTLIDDDWYRITIDLAATAKSTTAPDFVSRVNLSGTTANGYIKYMGKIGAGIHAGADGFTSSSAWADGLANHYFVTPYDSKVIDPATDTILFDVKFKGNSGQLSFYLNEFYYGRYCGPFSLTTAGVLTGTGASLLPLEDGWYRISIDLASTAKSAPAPNYVSRVNLYGTTANGVIKYMGLDSHAGAKEFTSSSAWKDGTGNYYFVSPSDSKVIDPEKDTAIFDVAFTSKSGQLSFYLNEYYYGRYCGPFTVTYDGVLSGDGATITALDGIDKGWYRITIDLESTAKSAPAPNYVSRINLSGTTASGYIRYMGLKAFTVTVEGGTGGGSYSKGSSVTAAATVPDGKVFVEWQSGGERVSTDSSYTFTVTEDVTLVAIFKDDPHLDATEFAASTRVVLDMGENVALNRTLLIDVKFTSAAGTKISLLLRQGDTMKYKAYIAVFKSGVSYVTGVSTESLSDGWLRIKIDLNTLVTNYDTTPSYISTIEATTYSDGSGYFMYMGVETCEIDVEGGTGGGTYEKGSSATVTATGDSSQFIGWKNGSGEWLSNSISYTFTVTADATISAVYGPVALSSGFDILIPDYETDYESILSLSLDVYVPNNTAVVYFGLYDGSGNYYGKYGVSYSGLLSDGCSRSGVETETLVANRKFRLTFTLDSLAAGSGTPGKIVKIKDLSSVSLSGCTIGNIAFSYLTNSRNSVVSLDVAENTEQVLKTDSVSVRQTNLKFTGAIGERETAQITMHATANISNKEFDVFFTDFKGTSGIIPSSAIETSIVQYINVDSNFVVSFGYTALPLGYYPDALLPLSVAKAAGENVLNVSNGNNQGLFFVLNIPSTATKGTYYGNVIITVENNDVMCLPVEIEVYGFALPEETAARTSVGTRMDLINDLYNVSTSDIDYNCSYYTALGDFLKKRGVNVSDIRGSVWWENSMETYITYLKQAAADPKVSSYKLDYNWDSYGDVKVSGTIYNDTTGDTSSLSKKNLGSIGFPRMEDISSGGHTYYGLKSVFTRLATESTNEVDLFKKAYIYSLYDEVAGESSIKILLNQYVVYAARDYVLANFNWTGKLSVKSSLENLRFIAPNMPWDNLYRGVTITVNSYTSPTFEGVTTSCGIPKGTSLTISMDAFMTEPVKYDQTGPYATGGTYSSYNRAVGNGVALLGASDDYELWWYIAVGGDPYWASFSVNASTLNNRINYWQMFKLGIYGMYHWDSACTEAYVSNGSGGWKFQKYDASWFSTVYGLSSSEYSALTTMERAAYIERYILEHGLIYQGEYGDGMLIYTVSATYGEYGADFLSTIRLETIAEATDDYNYLAYAQSLIDGLDGAEKTSYQSRLDALFGNLFANDDGNGKTVTGGFTANNGGFKTTRAALAALIEELLAL